jgi:hypothetical protein
MFVGHKTAGNPVAATGNCLSQRMVSYFALLLTNLKLCFFFFYSLYLMFFLQDFFLLCFVNKTNNGKQSTHFNYAKGFENNEAYLEYTPHRLVYKSGSGLASGTPVNKTVTPFLLDC